MNITGMRCDYMENPVGFDFLRPTLHWAVENAGVNKTQSAYQLQVALAPDFAGLLLDSGMVMSTQSIGYRLELPLSARTRYYWRVRVWDNGGADTGFSTPAFFETGRYGERWDAEWIGWDQEFPQLRRSFRIDKPVRSARAYACGVGLYHLFINGEHASDELLTPGFNAYDLWLQYQTYDITDKLAQGENAIGAWLGNGYYKGRVNWPSVPHREHIYGDRLAFIAELFIEYADGTSERIGTDTTWKAAKSPYLRAEIYDGEIYDARLHNASWCYGGFGDSAWERAQSVPLDMGLLQARRSVPVKVMHALPVREVLATPKGETVLDFGQNAAGRLRMRINAPAGQEIHIQFGEALDRHGNFYRDNMRTALAELRYIADGKEAEYAALFTFYGFRYARVSGLESVNPADFTFEVMYSEMEQTGFFECSNPDVNRLFENALWGQRGNFVDIPTDCPQRDERMGWTGDAQVFCPTACMNMEADAFFRKYLHDLALEQKKVGYVPVVVPFILHGSGIWELPTAGWGDAAVLMPWYVYLYYGDHAALSDQYESMKAWVEYIQAQDIENTGIYGGFHLGDWLAQDTKDPDNVFGMTPTSLVATAYYAFSAAHVAKAAKVLGRPEDAREYAALAEHIKAAFRREFVTPNGRVASETQTAYVLALYMDLLTPEQRPVAIRCLSERIVADKVRLTTGFLGTPYLCPALSMAGLDEYAYALLLQTDCPSWLYEVRMGATTVWERWNSVREDGSFGPESMNSLNHYAFGAIVEWLYRYVAGITPCAEAPGYKQARIEPRVNDQLSSAKASIRTPYGIIRSGWALSEGKLELEVEIPFNTSATIVLPDSDGAQIAENGALLAPQAWDAKGNTCLSRGSGVWRFAYVPSGNTISRRIVFPENAAF